MDRLQAENPAGTIPRKGKELPVSNQNQTKRSVDFRIVER